MEKNVLDIKIKLKSQHNEKKIEKKKENQLNMFKMSSTDMVCQ